LDGFTLSLLGEEDLSHFNATQQEATILLSAIYEHKRAEAHIRRKKDALQRVEEWIRENGKDD
jgi:hypothetical protein